MAAEPSFSKHMNFDLSFAVFERIFHEIGRGQTPQGFVSCHLHGRLVTGEHFDSLSLGFPHPRERLMDHLQPGKRHELHGFFPLRPGRHKHVVDKVAQIVNAFLHVAQNLAFVFFLEVQPSEGIQAQLDTGERRLQLMCDPEQQISLTGNALSLLADASLQSHQAQNEKRGKHGPSPRTIHLAPSPPETERR